MSNKQVPSSGITRRDLLKYGFFTALAGGLSGNFWLAGCEKKQQKNKRPNIFLITVDTLRADHLGCYGYPRKTSPNIDEFAKDSLLFENCFSHAPETLLSFSSIMTGFLPHETRIEKFLAFPSENVTLAEMLLQHDFVTLAVIGNYVLRKDRGWGQGFTVYDETMNDREPVRGMPESIAEHTTQRAIELVKRFCDDEIFMWVHYQDPHGPYTPPEHFAKQFINSDQEPHNLKINPNQSGDGGIPSYQRLGDHKDYHYYVSQYDGEIRYMDEYLKHLLESLKEVGIYDNSLIIFTADHGEELGEHNYFFSHGENLYAPLLHVPLIIRYGKKLMGRRIDRVQHIDIVPTIINFLGLKGNSSFRGLDLFERHETNREIFSEAELLPVKYGNMFSLLLDDMKLIYSIPSEQYQLFNIQLDPQEEHDLINNQKYQRQAEDLMRRLIRIRNEDFLGLKVVNTPPALTEQELKNLKSLGYVK